MASKRPPGPLCRTKTPVELDDGTLCRCASPLPGPIGNEPSVSTQFVWGAERGGKLEEEGWFENRYPNLIEDARLHFIEIIEEWILKNWGARIFPEPKKRIRVYARKVGGNDRNDNRFEACGDKPQSPHEADKTLGSFAIDIRSEFKIEYSVIRVNRVSVQTFEWETTMYVDDTLGLQESNNIVVEAKKAGISLDQILLKLAPSRRVTRAEWEIEGGGRCYVVKPGDTLAGIALGVYGDSKHSKKLYEVNKSRIANPNIIQIGMRLLVQETLE